jgi:hypothetical protein
MPGRGWTAHEAAVSVSPPALGDRRPSGEPRPRKLPSRSRRRVAMAAPASVREASKSSARGGGAPRVRRSRPPRPAARPDGSAALGPAVATRSPGRAAEGTATARRRGPPRFRRRPRRASCVPGRGGRGTRGRRPGEPRGASAGPHRGRPPGSPTDSARSS